MNTLSKKDLWRVIGTGIVAALILLDVSVTGMNTGILPLPKSLALAFAETILGRELPLAVGVAIHPVSITCLFVIYMALYRYKMAFIRKMGSSAVLCISILVFFPLAEWGLFGLNVSPMPVAGSAVPYLLCAIILWSLCRVAFHGEHAAIKHTDG